MFGLNKKQIKEIDENLEYVNNLHIEVMTLKESYKELSETTDKLLQDNKLLKLNIQQIEALSSRIDSINTRVDIISSVTKK